MRLRIEVDETLDGRRRTGSRESADNKLPRRGGLERNVDHRRGAQRLDDQDVGILPQRLSGHRDRLVFGPAHFTLTDERATPLVNDGDLAFDRDYVLASAAIDEIHERRHDRARSTCPRGSDDIRLLAGMDHQRVAVDAHDGLKIGMRQGSRHRL